MGLRRFRSSLNDETHYLGLDQSFYRITNLTGLLRGMRRGGEPDMLP